MRVADAWAQFHCEEEWQWFNRSRDFSVSWNSLLADLLESIVCFLARRSASDRFLLALPARGAGSMQLSAVRLSVCPIRPPHAAGTGLLTWARRPGVVDRLLHGHPAGGQQQPRRSTARSSKCGQCHVVG